MPNTTLGPVVKCDGELHTDPDLRADGTIRKPRGTRTRGGGTRGAKNADGTTTSTRGGAGRGQPATRKPRMTKASRALLEKEKAEREQAGAVAMNLATTSAGGAGRGGVGIGMVGIGRGGSALGSGTGRGGGGVGRGSGGGGLPGLDNITQVDHPMVL